MVRYIDEYRDSSLANSIAARIHEIMPDKPLRFMEVCGGHTVTIHKYGIRSLLPEKLHLISGPGCPVCVTSTAFIDTAIQIARHRDTIITTFGDMMRVPGSESSLLQEQSAGADVRICYSPQDALDIAVQNPKREVVFLGIGFETTVPAVAATILSAARDSVENFSVLSSHKTMPNAMKAIVSAGEVALNGFICPGHVSAITGLHIYEFLACDYRMPCVISGFEPVDMLETIYLLVKQAAEGRSAVENQYTRAVRNEGNLKALQIVREVFEECDDSWRGIGVIEKSGLGIRPEYGKFDASNKFEIEVPCCAEFPGCICGEIMRGVRIPTECSLFGKICRPEDPKGACMVSHEGACATYYQYGGGGES